VQSRAEHSRTVAILVALFLTAATTSAFAREFRAADTQSEDYPTVQALRYMGRLIAERSNDRLLLARALLAAGEALGSSMPGEARGWHDRGIALSREIGAVALVRAHQVG